MSSRRVIKKTLSLSIYDVVGSYGKQSGFIDHVGLAKFSSSQSAAKFPVIDMGPPLHGQNSVGSMRASVVGSVALTDDEVQKIQVFVDKHENEHGALQVIGKSPLTQVYCVHPHKAEHEENDWRYPITKFSCVGFVFEAYKTARIELLDTSLIPMIDMDAIKLAYPLQTRLMGKGTITPGSLGLTGNGPWPVMLCGYLFHALNRAAGVIRNQAYAPKPSDKCFP